MSIKITFTNTAGFDLEAPQPAAKYLPDWYKNMPPYIGANKTPDMEGISSSTATIKKCIPVFDAITAGYILTSPADLYTDFAYPDLIDNNVKSQVRLYRWPNNNLIGFHPTDQIKDHPLQTNDENLPKFMSPWSIRTPKGYSCLFVQPFHRESVFTIMPGIVDTDTYFGNINFPFVLNDPEFVGLVPKGTPFVQIIPFKRTAWKSELGNADDVKKAYSHAEEVRTTFFDYYKRYWHSKKEYK